MTEITLTELINVNTIQKIQDAFANATGMAALTVDLNGSVTHLSNPTEFCMKLTRGCPKGAERCNQCDLRGGEEAGRTGHPSVYYCHGGLMDFAAPILLGNKQIGSMLGGQVLPEPPDEAKFRRIAKEIGVDENEYIRALSRIKIMPKKTIEAGAQLLYAIANELSEMGYQKYKTQTLASDLIQVSSELHKTVATTSKYINDIETHNNKLLTSVGDLTATTKHSKEEVNKTNQIVKYISDISMETKLLGFNASVEASRAKEYGASFNIIAQEIRRLAEDSQRQSTNINKIINTIKNNISNIDKRIDITYSSMQDNTLLLNNISETVNQISGFAERLKDLSKQV